MSKYTKPAYPQPIYSDYASSYGSPSANNSFIGGAASTTMSSQAMSKQLEKAWKELATGKYSSKRRNSTTSSAIEEEVRNIYDQVALQVRRGDSMLSTGNNNVMGSPQLNSNYSRSEKSFINFFRAPKPNRGGNGFSEHSNSRILSTLTPSQYNYTYSQQNTTGNYLSRKTMYTIPVASNASETNPPYLTTDDKESIVPGMIFFIIGFLLFPFWWFASIVPLHPVTEKEFKWRKINRYASLISILLIAIAAGITIYFVFIK